jgi:toxin ParE1/3/4
VRVPLRLRWTSQAREDLLEIYCLIGIDNPAAADRMLGSIEARIKTLEKHPRIGPRRPEIRTSTRILVEEPYLILYETEPDTDHGALKSVNIIRIVDGRRNLKRLF